jgi:hypothetical protein
MVESEAELGRIDVLHRRGGELTKRMMLKYEVAPAPGDDLGEVQAAAGLQAGQALAEAICRYINCGGSFDDARQICEGTLANILTVTGGVEVFPVVAQPWTLLRTDTPMAEHVFFDPNNGNAVIWREGEEILPSHLDRLDQSNEPEGEDSESIEDSPDQD